ncbi:MAG: sigma-70 family RNA polymerase sigma factor [Streptococcaceae bacterium]|jgi:RNA polymerase sigma factor (sigma-70 family)|nr:sigma-70 family RNA polymerase sigma factor [Streptococcaceae bacterium]
MKNFRTKKSNRETYRYYFVTGDRNEIEVTDDVMASDIALLHQFDDEEVNAEHKTRYHVAYYLEDFLNEDKGAENHPMLVDNRHPLAEILDGEDQEMRAQLFEALHQALETLTAKQKIAIEKIFYQDKTQLEIAREEHVGRTAIEQRLEQALKKLRKNFKKDTVILSDFSVNK